MLEAGDSISRISSTDDCRSGAHLTAPCCLVVYIDVFWWPVLIAAFSVER